MPTDKPDPKRPQGRPSPSTGQNHLDRGSLPPALHDVDLGWDDDVPPSGGIEGMVRGRRDGDGELDPTERTTTVPRAPMEQIVAHSLAEIKAQEASRLAASTPEVVFADGSTFPSTDSSPDPPTLPLQPPEQDHRRADPCPTEPAPARTTDPSALMNLELVDLSEGGLAAEPLGFSGLPASEAPPSGTGSEASDASQNVAPPSRTSSDADPVRGSMKDRYAIGDFTGALSMAEAILGRDAGDLEAQRYATSCRDVLSQMYASRLGSLEQIVAVALTPEELRWLTLDHRAGFMVSMIDGASTIAELLDISGMTRLDALRILSHLLEQRVIRLQMT